MDSAELRRLVLDRPELRSLAGAVVEEMLLGVADLDDDESATEWLAEYAQLEHDHDLTAGELRARLRGTLEDLAARD